MRASRSVEEQEIAELMDKIKDLLISDQDFGCRYEERTRKLELREDKILPKMLDTVKELKATYDKLDRLETPLNRIKIAPIPVTVGGDISTDSLGKLEHWCKEVNAAIQIPKVTQSRTTASSVVAAASIKPLQSSKEAKVSPKSESLADVKKDAADVVIDVLHKLVIAYGTVLGGSTETLELVKMGLEKQADPKSKLETVKRILTGERDAKDDLSALKDKDKGLSVALAMRSFGKIFKKGDQNKLDKIKTILKKTEFDTIMAHHLESLSARDRLYGLFACILEPSRENKNELRDFLLINSDLSACLQIIHERSDNKAVLKVIDDALPRLFELKTRQEAAESQIPKHGR